MRVLSLGDVHGNREFLLQFYKHYLPTVNCDVIVQVGDLTISWGGCDVEEFFDYLAELVRISGIPFYFIDGNHEYFNVLFEKYLKGDTERFVEIRPNVFYIPRGFAWEWDGVRFMGMGGAYSFRGSDSKLMVNWFPQQEQASYADIDRALGRGRVDVLFTHDVPKGTYHMTKLHEHHTDERCETVRRNLYAVAESCKPRINIHGHHHQQYRELWEASWGDVRVVGLNADYTSFTNNECVYLLDTEDL